MRLVWDENKSQTNLAKHGISFSTAAKVFDDPRALSFPDRVVEGEQRWKSIGWAAGGPVILAVAHTVSEEGPGEINRIISARKRKGRGAHLQTTQELFRARAPFCASSLKATPGERRNYEESDS